MRSALVALLLVACSAPVGDRADPITNGALAARSDRAAGDRSVVAVRKAHSAGRPSTASTISRAMRSLRNSTWNSPTVGSMWSPPMPLSLVRKV